MGEIKPLHVYAGGPVTNRGEATRLGVDPTGTSDDITYASGRVAVIRSAKDPLKANVFAMHTHPVTVVKMSADGEYVVSADEGGFVRVWNPKTLKQKVGEQVSGGPIRDIAVSNDGKFSAVVGDSRGMFAKCIKLPSAGSAGACSGHSKRVICCDVSQTKPPMTATGSEDMSAGVFKGPPVREIDTPKFLRHHKGFINDIKFSPDGTKLAIGSSDKTVSIVDVATLDVNQTLSGHQASVTGVSWSKCGKKILSSGNDKTNILWDVESGSVLKKTTFGNNVMDMQVGCAILPKSGRLVSISLSGDITVRDPDADEADMVFRGHSKQIVGLVVVGNDAYTADYSGRMVAWEIGVGAARKSFNGKGPTTSVSALAGNDKIIVNVGMDGKVYVTQRDSLEYGKPMTLKGGAADVCVPSGNAPFAAAVINETRVALVDKDGSELSTIMDLASSDKGVSIDCTSDGSKIVIGVEVSGGAGEYRFLKVVGDELVQDGEAVKTLSAPNRVKFSDDGKSLAVGEKNRRVKAVAMDDGSKLAGGTGHTARVDALAFSKDGKKLVSGGMDGSITLWGIDNDDDPVKLMGAHRNGVTGLAFIDDNTIISVGSDSCLRTWKI